jgi:hypothetical protein
MNLNFNLSNSSVNLILPNDEKYKSQLLIQNGYFGKGQNISNGELAVAVVNNYTPILDRSIKYIAGLDNLTILDIGSGNSIIDVALAKIFPKAKFILLDGNEWNSNHNLHSDNFKPYNHWVHVENTIKLNNLDITRFKFVGLDYDFDDQPNYILSYGSMGLHYPIEMYLEKIHHSLADNGILAVGPILNINSQIQTVNQLFKPLEIIELTNFVSREKLQLSQWAQYFPQDFSGPFAHAGVWRKK